MNLVSEASENLYIFQPGGYFVRATTSAAGMFAAGPKLVMKFHRGVNVSTKSVFGLWKSNMAGKSPNDVDHCKSRFAYLRGKSSNIVG